MKQILIIGAGYAGILAAKKLSKRLKREDVKITVIDKHPFHTMLTELHEVAAGRVDEDSIRISLKKVFAGRNIDFVLDTAEHIDFERREVIGSGGKYSYDYLVIAAGSQPTFFNVKGAKEHSYKLWSYEDAVILNERILDCFRRACEETDAAERRRLLTFYVVGAGFTGVEMAGELAEYAPILCKKFGLDKSEVTMVNVDILDRVVPILPEKLSAKVEKRLLKMGVKTMLKTSVCAIGEDFIELQEGKSCVRYPAGTVVWTAGIQSADLTMEIAEKTQFQGRGRIVVDEYLRCPKQQNVYVIGDNMFFIPKGSKEPVPQMVENCEQSADTAARNICAAITGKGELEEYEPKFHGVMVSVGGRYGVARVGTAKHMLNLPSFFAMFTKHFINIVYFIQVLGWNKVWSYLKHEFFTIRNTRSFVGGHLSNRTPSFLLVPLRVWLGAAWLFEGVMKIVEGWFKTPKLTDFFGGSNAWYNSILQGANAVKTAADTVSSATGTAGGGATAATQAGKVLIDWNLWLFKVIFVCGRDISQASIGDYAFKIDVPLMNLFIEKAILGSSGMQIFMQVFIVIAEILIGLALMGGLFTTPASALSLVLSAMFVTTTGLYLGTFWMVFAAVAVLIGGGRTFGLDYYAMPYLKEKWKKLPVIRKLYLYND